MTKTSSSSSSSSFSNTPFLGYEKACRLTKTLPSLPVFRGALDQELRLYDETTTAAATSVNRSSLRNDVLAQATKIADLLRYTFVSYLNPREGVSSISHSSTEPCYHKVLKYDYEACQYCTQGLINKRNPSMSKPGKKLAEQNGHSTSQRKHEGALNLQSGGNRDDSSQTYLSSKRRKVEKKGIGDVSLTQPDPSEVQDGIIRGYTERLEALCSRAETSNEDQDEAVVQLLSSNDLKLLMNDTMTIRGKKILHLVPLDILVRFLRVLDLQIRAAEGVSLNCDSDAMSLENRSLESIRAALAVMTHPDMPKQLYTEEVTRRVPDFSRHQIMESEGCGTFAMTFIRRNRTTHTFSDTRGLTCVRYGSIRRFYKMKAPPKYRYEREIKKIFKLGKTGNIAIAGWSGWGIELHRLMSLRVKPTSSPFDIQKIAFDCMKEIPKEISDVCCSKAIITCYDNVTHAPKILVCDSQAMTVKFHQGYAFYGTCHDSIEEFLNHNYNGGYLTKRAARRLGKDCLGLAFGTAETDRIGRRLGDDAYVGGFGKYVFSTWRKRKFRDLRIKKKFLFNGTAHLLR